MSDTYLFLLHGLLLLVISSNTPALLYQSTENLETSVYFTFYGKGRGYVGWLFIFRTANTYQEVGPDGEVEKVFVETVIAHGNVLPFFPEENRKDNSPTISNIKIQLVRFCFDLKAEVPTDGTYQRLPDPEVLMLRVPTHR
ncbi:unnamed protein product [Penicillium viridicatum]